MPGFIGDPVLIACPAGTLSKALVAILGGSGVATVVAHSFPAAESLVREVGPAVVILDLELPEGEGVGMIESLRNQPERQGCGVLAMTSRDDWAFRREVLEAGADDVQSKATVPEELALRALAIARRIGSSAVRAHAIRVGDLTLDPATLSVRLGHRTVSLSPVEFQIMLALSESPDQVMDNEALQQRLWGAATPSGVAGLRVHMNRIRGRIEPTRSEPRYLKTVRGKGYMLLSTPERP